MAVEDWFPPDVVKLALAGFAGSYVAIATTTFSGLKAAALRLSSGTLTAIYFGPVVSKFLSPYTTALEPGQVTGLAAFLVGVSGMTLVTFLLDMIVAKRAGVLIRQRNLGTEAVPATKSAREAVAAEATEAPDAN
ncbi:hypothetical protein [Methylopila sp. M107]|uniref:hypothetical protein n=1 Tax=Methylopila sp. M107 TaxID=1101190 RepID=UPI00037B93FB|nr:hypothetical protein [Methylopila sp. M107]